jgi:hypothetical protein
LPCRVMDLQLVCNREAALTVSSTQTRQSIDLVARQL